MSATINARGPNISQRCGMVRHCSGAPFMRSFIAHEWDRKMVGGLIA